MRTRFSRDNLDMLYHSKIPDPDLELEPNPKLE